MRSFFKDIMIFYKHDICWPYAVSFLFVLAIYAVDFLIAPTVCHWASVVGFGILFLYYLYIVRLFFAGLLFKKNIRFFMSFLSAKIASFAWLLIIAFCV